MKRHFEIHEHARHLPMATDSEIADMAADIKEHGLRNPIVLFEEKILDGRNRLKACEIAGVEPEFVIYDGMDPLADVVSWNIQRRHLTTSQKAAAAVELKGAFAKQAKERMQARKGKQPGATKANLPDLAKGQSRDQAAAAVGVSGRTVQNAEFVKEHAPELFQEVKTGNITVDAALKKTKPKVTHNSGDKEWYTPESYIAAATMVMEQIELDPASSKEANAVVKANRFYTKKENGLKQNWRGTVWMNPPYNSSLVGKFVEKLATSVESRKVTEAIVLVNNATETKWFARLAVLSSFFCFPTGRIKFWHTQKKSDAPLQGQCLAYIGKNGKRFCQKFKPFGLIVEIVR